ncbi:hypothetical protein CTEN210_06302 [Chaetoceros tenuissimus]|uniref:C3H1-type domain-containing protein n=1 Tax=Chaetoceros tenuissimus TaxID=426638 RepID=A0AAD3CPL2_9STRA|nr:hypothetical protein CTEN210_06302 [Chaetoceros tenuissimus]
MTIMSKQQLIRPLCRFYLMGKCRYTDEVCTFSHRSGEGDETIEEARKNIHCPFHENKEKRYLRCRHQSNCWFSHGAEEEEEGEEELSADLVCTVIEKGQRFALFSDCDHTCCYCCARKWHRNKHRRDAILARPAEAQKHVHQPGNKPLMRHSCPMCRQLSKNLYPSKHYLKGEEKKAYIATYIDEQNKRQCHYYASGTCPFGDECNFQHVDENGNDLFELHNSRLKARLELLKELDADPIPLENSFAQENPSIWWDWDATDDDDDIDDESVYGTSMHVSSDAGAAEWSLANENPFSTYFNENEEEAFHHSTNTISGMNGNHEDCNVFASVMAQYHEELAARDNSPSDEMERSHALSFLRD